MFDANKRRFPRANYPCSLTIWQEGGLDTLLANTANIGAGGLSVHLDQRLEIGLKVDIRVDFSKTETFQCCGRVLRCQENQPSGSPKFYAVAIVFEGLDEEKVFYLKKQVERLRVS